MRFKKKPPLTPREIRAMIVLAALGAIVISGLIGANIGLSRIVPGGGGFYAAWEGARAKLFMSTDPYSGAVAMLAQERAYGRFAAPGENPYFLTIPFFLLPFYFPFAWLSDLPALLFPSVFTVDPNIARGLWMMLNEAALAAAALLSLRLIEWEPRRAFPVFFSLLSVFGFYSVASLMDGSPVILLGLIYISILLALSQEQDELAGALLVLTLFYWEVSLLFAILIFWKIFSGKRWRALAGFGMLFSILLILSFFIYPAWIYPFLTATLASIRAEFGLTTAAVFIRLAPPYGARISQALTIFIIIMLVYEWAAARASDFRRFVWAACLTLAVTPLLGLRTELGNLVIMFPSLALIFAAIANRWKTGYWLAGLLLAFVFLVPWSLFMRFTLLDSRLSRDLLFLFYPFFTILGLYWTRWWFIRPPRTWLDHVRSTLN